MLKANAQGLMGFVLGVLVLGGMGCGDSSRQTDGAGGAAVPDRSTSPAKPRPNPQTENQVNCASLAYNEGAPANESLLSTPQIVSTSFSKSYDRSLLDAVEGASTAELVRVLNSNLKINIQRSSGKFCRYFSALPEVSGELKKIWDEVDRSSEGLALGLYTNREKVLETGEVTLVPEIVIKYDSGRWTLIHEYMHYVFHRNQIESGKSNLALGRKLQKAVSDAQNADLVFQQEQTVGNLVSFASAVIELYNVADERNKESMLEEAVIEDILADRYVAGTLKNVKEWEVLNKDYARGALATMKETYKGILAQLEELDKALVGMSREAKNIQEVFSLEQSLLAKEALKQKLQSVILEMDAIIIRADQRLIATEVSVKPADVANMFIDSVQSLWLSPASSHDDQIETSVGASNHRGSCSHGNFNFEMPNFVTLQ